jgi:hypothetical protein
LQGVLDQKLIDQAMSAGVGALRLVNSNLEAAFIKEAISLMSGSRTLADTISEIGSTLLTEKENLSERLKEQ